MATHAREAQGKPVVRALHATVLGKAASGEGVNILARRTISMPLDPATQGAAIAAQRQIVTVGPPPVAVTG